MLINSPSDRCPLGCWPGFKPVSIGSSPYCCFSSKPVFLLHLIWDFCTLRTQSKTRSFKDRNRTQLSNRPPFPIKKLAFFHHTKRTPIGIINQVAFTTIPYATYPLTHSWAHASLFLTASKSKMFLHQVAITDRNQ